MSMLQQGSSNSLLLVVTSFMSYLLCCMYRWSKNLRHNIRGFVTSLKIMVCSQFADPIGHGQASGQTMLLNSCSYIPLWVVMVISFAAVNTSLWACLMDWWHVMIQNQISGVKWCTYPAAVSSTDSLSWLKDLCHVLPVTRQLILLIWTYTSYLCSKITWWGNLSSLHWVNLAQKWKLWIISSTVMSGLLKTKQHMSHFACWLIQQYVTYVERHYYSCVVVIFDGLSSDLSMRPQNVQKHEAVGEDSSHICDCFGFQLYILISDQQAFLGNVRNKASFINLLSQLSPALYLHLISHLQWLMTRDIICTYSAASEFAFVMPISGTTFLSCFAIYFSWLNAFKYLTIILCNMYYANNLQK